MEFYQMKADILPRMHFVDKAIIEPPYVHKKRKPDEYIMYIIVHGEMFLTEENMKFHLKSGDICILDKDRTHEGVKATNCEYYYIHFMHDDFTLIPEISDEAMTNLLFQERQNALKSNTCTYDKCDNNYIWFPKHWHLSNTGEFIRFEEWIMQAIRENHNPLENYKILCACKIQQLFIEMSRCYITMKKEQLSYKLPSFYTKVQEILEWLNQHYAEKISGERLEKIFHSNFDYMNRVFKKVTGSTIFQYLTEIRINHAKILILHTSMRMKEIGEKVGFPDEYYFNRVFKRYVGSPPATYAKLILLKDFEDKVVIG